MPVVHKPKLELLKHSHSKKTATIRVSYTLHQTPLERQLSGLSYRETIELWGADPGPDDYRYTFPIKVFLNTSSVHIKRDQTVSLGDEVLDEDKFPFLNLRDEIYARVCVKPILPTTSCRNSNEIKHKF